MKSTSILDDDFHISKTGKAAHEKAIRTRLSSASYVKNTSSKSPQAILKVASYSKGVSVKRVMDYVSRTDRDEKGIPAENEDGKQLHGKEEIKDLYEKWSEDFEQKKRGGKTNPRHATHIVLSAKTDNSEKSVKQVHAAARAFLQQEFASRGYEYMFVIHKDTANPHIHVVIKNKNNVLNEKLRIGKAELFELRQEFSTKLQKEGIEAISTLRRDRPEIIAAVAKQLDTIKNRSEMMDKRIRGTEKISEQDALQMRAKKLLDIQSLKYDKQNTSDEVASATDNYQSAFLATLDLRRDFSSKPDYVRGKSDHELAYHAVKKEFGEFRVNDKEAMELNTNNGKGVTVQLPDGKSEHIENQKILFEKIVEMNKEKGTFYDEAHIQRTSPSDYQRLSKTNNDMAIVKKEFIGQFTDRKTGYSALKQAEDTVNKVYKDIYPNVRSQKTPALDTFEIRRNQLLGIDRLKREIKKSTHALTPERAELNKQLTSLQKTIAKNDLETLPKQVNATVNAFKTADKELTAQLTDILNDKRPPSREQRQDRKRKEAAFSKYSEKYIKNIKLAMKDITINRAIPDQLKKEVLQALRVQRKSVDKLQARAFRFGL